MSLLEFEEPSIGLVSYTSCLYTQLIKEKSKFNDPDNLFLSVSNIENLGNQVDQFDFSIPVKNLQTLDTQCTFNFINIFDVNITKGNIICGYHKPSEIYHVYFEAVNKTFCFKKKPISNSCLETYNIDFIKHSISGKFGFSSFDYIVCLNLEISEVHFCRYKIDLSNSISSFEIISYLVSIFQNFQGKEFKDFIGTIFGKEYVFVGKDDSKTTSIYNYSGKLLAQLPFLIDNIDDATGSVVLFYAQTETFYITLDDWQNLLFSPKPNKTKIIKKFDTYYTDISCQQNDKITIYILRCRDHQYVSKTDIYQLYNNKLYNVCEASDIPGAEIKLLPNGDIEVWKNKQLRKVYRIHY